MRVLLDKTTDLREFLNKYGSSLRNVRAFYIVEPLLDSHPCVWCCGLTALNW